MSMETTSLECQSISTESFNNLTRRLSTLQLNPDQSWKDLHSWAYNYRISQNLTIDMFLTSICKLAPTASYRKYLSKCGDTMFISSKVGTIGYLLRQSLETARRDIDSSERIVNSSINMISNVRFTL